ncbi:hypothetical protein E1287_21090 [Actinomadura sp. KC06]|uniref:hypothetical protein n=1 Tax=Actinomadura sp. KC06 TaxID=2530369 RepID=UPI00105349E1|nr:hypothetical protein [Actinomadura sp. KC06]TDD32900.1 hypothetical protein E1287_21090 [Actinomadura sp. KC06]
MNDSSTADSHGGRPLLTSRKHQGSAARAIAQRILTVERPQLLNSLPPAHLNVDHGGLVVCGSNASARLQALRSAFNGVLSEDIAAYEKQTATPTEPFALPTGGMFGCDLPDVVQQQIDRGASFAITPTRYVNARDSASLKAILKEVSKLERDDVLVVLPVAIGWLQDETARRQLTAVINLIPHPVALAFGCQFNPMDAFAAAVINLRTLLKDAPGTGLWRTDMAGFDALAHGGAFAAIGAGGAVRHLVPAGERAETAKDKSGGPVYPTVLLPQMLRFSDAKFLADTYANAPAPRCGCPQCGGTMLDLFFGLTNAVKAAANAHNVAAWNVWLPELLAEQGTERQRWWRDRCKLALDAQAAENIRIGMPGRFKPAKHLKKWAALSIDGEPADHHGRPV